MNNTEKLDAAIALITEVRASLGAKTRYVTAGDDLATVLDEASPGDTLQLSDDFTHIGSLVIRKPLTITGGMLVGPTVIDAPDVTLIDVYLKGMNKGHTILTTGERTRVINCTIVGSGEGQHRGICVNSRDVIIRETSVTNIWHSIDTQAIGGWNGTKNLLVEDCHLEASGENVMFGGADPSSEDNIPQDIVFRRCTMTKPLEWRNQTGAVSKNLFELKNAKRVLVEDCVMEHSWVQGQTGFGILLTVRNQDGTAPYSTIEDVTFRRVTVRHCASGISLLGTDDNFPSVPMKRILFEDVVFEDINPVTWGNGIGGRQIQFNGHASDVVFRNVTMSGANNNSAMMFSDGSRYDRLVVDNCTFEEGEYGLFSPVGLGLVSLIAHAWGYVWTNVTIKRGPSGRNITYPVGTTVV